jgi:hypothetical protein
MRVIIQDTLIIESVGCAVHREDHQGFRTNGTETFVLGLPTGSSRLALRE